MSTFPVRAAIFDNVIRLYRYRPIYGFHNGCDQRFIAVAMAGPAGHHLAAPKVAFVDIRNHEHHLARHLLSRGVRRPIHLIGAGADMTIRTVEVKGRGHDSHGLHKVVDGEPLEHLDILEGLFRQERFLLRSGLCHRQPDADQQRSNSAGRNKPASRAELHVMSHRVIDARKVTVPRSRLAPLGY